MKRSLDSTRELFEKMSVLVVDPSSSFGQTISDCLRDLGVPKEKVIYSKSFSESVQIINAKKPQMLITEYYLGSRFGMELVNLHSSMVDNRIAVMITHNASASAIAEAAEELVDDYILKPFSAGALGIRLRELVDRRLNPPEYLIRIREGKVALAEGNFEQAEEDFKKAVPLDDSPTLAYYYLGYTKHLKNLMTGAVTDYRKGLSIRPMHYKCLVGEFDAHCEQKQYVEAYKLAPAIIENYPLSPKRLGAMFIAAVFTRHLDDIPKYYEVFMKLEHKPQELRKVFSAALLTAGRFHAKEAKLERAVECFDLGISVIGSNADYIEKIIRELIKLNQQGAEAASKYLLKYPHQEVGSSHYKLLSFLIDQQVKPIEQAIEIGRKLVSEGLADAEAFTLLVRLMTQAHRLVAAEDVALKAIVAFPGLRKELYDMIEAAKLSEAATEK